MDDKQSLMFERQSPTLVVKSHWATEQDAGMFGARFKHSLPDSMSSVLATDRENKK